MRRRHRPARPRRAGRPGGRRRRSGRREPAGDPAAPAFARRTSKRHGRWRGRPTSSRASPSTSGWSQAAVAAGAGLRRRRVRRVVRRRCRRRRRRHHPRAARSSARTGPSRWCAGRSGFTAPRPGTVAIALRGYAPSSTTGRRGEQLLTMTHGHWPAYAWAFPVGDGRANVGYGELHPRRRAPTRTQSGATVCRRCCPARLVPSELRGHRLPLSPGRPTLADGAVLLAGDAASLINPLTGEGIYYAVLSGSLAGAAAMTRATRPRLPTRPARCARSAPAPDRPARPARPVAGRAGRRRRRRPGQPGRVRRPRRRRPGRRPGRAGTDRVAGPQRRPAGAWPLIRPPQHQPRSGRVSGRQRKASISARVGAVVGPRRVTLSAAPALARRAASGQSVPRLRSATRIPVWVSPAPLVSTGSCGKPGDDMGTSVGDHHAAARAVPHDDHGSGHLRRESGGRVGDGAGSGPGRGFLGVARSTPWCGPGSLRPPRARPRPGPHRGRARPRRRATTRPTRPSAGTPSVRATCSR